MNLGFAVLTISTDEFDKLPHRSMPGVLSEKPMPSTALRHRFFGNFSMKLIALRERCVKKISLIN